MRIRRGIEEVQRRYLIVVEGTPCGMSVFTQLKIKQISAMVGIDDSNYFSRQFTKIIGISPKKYRRSRPVEA